MLSVLRRARVRWAGGMALAGCVLFWCYLLQSRSNGVDSDAAAFALQGWDMLHGNVLLHGWTGADVSFYTTEVPEYAAVEWIRGLRPDDVHVCAALTYTLLVLLTALVARGPARGREWVVRALLAGGIMIAPQAGLGTNTLLESPDHTGTGVPVMLILLLLDRFRPRWYWLLAHHLQQGLSGYWQADSVTLDSGGQAILAPVYGGAPYFWETKAAWYEPAETYANFVVSVTSPTSAAVFTRPAVMLRVFGAPARTFRFQQYVIMVWDKNILADLEVTPQTS